MKTIVFDIETGPLPEDELLAVMPAFDPAEVRTGHLKDPVKIAEKVAEAEASHRREFIERAALDPLTGRVLAIGLDYGPDEEPELFFGPNEAELLRVFWSKIRGEYTRLHTLVGFNITQFDLPFLIRRSWKHRVPVPFGLRRGRYWGDMVVDLRDWWQLGDRQARGSLDAIAKHLGVGAKTGSGADFAGLLFSNPTAATGYLLKDLELTRAIAVRVGAMPEVEEP
jgi:hypothetical protein